jgi:flagella synthesis protein FlgN
MSGTLLKHVTQELVAVRAFLELLDQEAQAMIHGDFTKLAGLAGRKSELADQIVLIGKQRESEQLALGYDADRTGADAAAAAGGEALQEAWRDLLSNAAEARACNHRNGVMVHTHLDFTRQSLGFLHASGQPLYGPDGVHKTGMGSGNSLAMG